ncbi:hypothetical protein [Actinoplanes sp. NPDC049118]|uniref:hypothetical protein n=1 Tax=Actinoplanes sp. NPDC049118 TaxID=3155769 RepID=UPI0033E6C091
MDSREPRRCTNTWAKSCLTFVKGVDETEALRRMGGYPDSFAGRTGEELAELMDDFDEGYPRMAGPLISERGRW